MEIAFGDEFIFKLDTTLFDEVQRQSPERFSSHERVGQRPALQHIGPGTDLITLPGCIFHSWVGDNHIMDDLYAIKEDGAAHELWTMSNWVGQRFMPGSWVITNISETQSSFVGAGQAKQIDWTLSLSRYD